MRFPPTRRLGGPLRTGNFGPTFEAAFHLFAVRRRGQQMPSGAEVLGNGSIGREKPLRMPCRLKPLHAILPLARGPMRVLAPVIEVTALTVFDPRQYLALGCAITFQLIRNDDPWHLRQALEELPEELLRRLFVASALDEDIQDVVVLIHRAPQVMAFAVNRQQDLIQMPFISRL